MRNQDGFALFSSFLLLLLLLTLGSASVVNTVLELRSTAHYNTGNQAFLAAESGVLHALSAMNGVGVVDFEADVVRRWDRLLGEAPVTVPGYPAIGYRVSVAADPGDAANSGSITATGFAPLRARRVVRVAVRRGGYAGTLAGLYLAADKVKGKFSGNAFEVDGNDHTVFGEPVEGGVVKPGIGTRNDTVKDSIVGALGEEQKDNIRGLGFSEDPLTPSVVNTGGPSPADLDRMVEELLEIPGVAATSQSAFNGNVVFGTLESPQITYMSAAHVKLNGTATGAGILIVNGSITITGTLDFVGWVLVRGSAVVDGKGKGTADTEVMGNATILGSLWTGHLAIKVGGSAIIDYCDACLRLADGTGGGLGNLPRPMKVESWREVF